MKPDALRAVGGAMPQVGQGARRGCAQARRAGISAAVGDLIHPKSPSGAASGTRQRPSNIGGDAVPLGLGVRGRCAWATDRPALRAFAGDRGRADGRSRTDERTELGGHHLDVILGAMQAPVPVSVQCAGGNCVVNAKSRCEPGAEQLASGLEDRKVEANPGDTWASQ